MLEGGSCLQNKRKKLRLAAEDYNASSKPVKSGEIDAIDPRRPMKASARLPSQLSDALARPPPPGKIAIPFLPGLLAVELYAP